MIDRDQQFDSVDKMLTACRRDSATKLESSTSADIEHLVRFAARRHDSAEFQSGTEAEWLADLQRSVEKMAAGYEHLVVFYYYGFIGSKVGAAGVMFQGRPPSAREVEFGRADSTFHWRKVVARVESTDDRTGQPQAATHTPSVTTSGDATADRSVVGLQGSAKHWKCPECHRVLQKAAPDTDSLFGTVVGTVSCGNCGARFDRRDIYAGRYDVDPLASVQSAELATFGRDGSQWEAPQKKWWQFWKQDREV